MSAPKTAREIGEKIAVASIPLSASMCLEKRLRLAVSVESAILEAVKSEREACAKIARITAEERAHLDRWTGACVLIEQRIRERGE